MLKGLVALESAKNDPSIRQHYLNQMMQYCPTSVSKVVYDQTSDMVQHHIDELFSKGLLYPDERLEYLEQIVKQNSTCATVIMGKKTIKVGGTHPVFVFPCAFDEFKSEEQAISIIADHEGAHASQVVNGFSIAGLLRNDIEEIGKLESMAFCLAIEINAYSHQGKMFIRRGFDDNRFLDKINFRMRVAENHLRSYLKSKHSYDLGTQYY